MPKETTRKRGRTLKRRGPTEKKPAREPRFKATPEMRESVSVWKAGGMSDENIALALSIGVNTLKKNFDAELTRHWAKKLADVTMARYTAAMNGNVSAQTKFIEASRGAGIEALMGAPSGTARLPHRGPERKERVVPIGKKEATEIAAKTAGLGTDWGDDLLPSGRVQ